MRNTEYFKNKRVTIVGLARSGIACAKLLRSLHARVKVSDMQDTLRIRAEAAALQSEGIEVEIGGHTEAFICGCDLMVVSPGVPINSPVIQWARARHIPVFSEIEVGWRLCPATIIAVTGSTGKTTVTTLLAQVLQAAGKKVFMCGNIGTPFCSLVSDMRGGDFVSLEVSSFQLEFIEQFKPYIACLLNLNRNHLDRHRDMQEYLDAKKRIFMNQDEHDYVVVNQDDANLKVAVAGARAKVRSFQAFGGYNPNQAAVIEVCKIFGISAQIYDVVFKQFKGLEHRLEVVDEINGVTFINDSKATVAESTVWALRSIPAQVILIAGGRHKGVDYRTIIPFVKPKVKAMVLIGEAKEEIRAALTGTIPLEDASTLEDAVSVAYQKALPGEYVLLSPMCSSFDMFRDYEHRGLVFKQIVQKLKLKNQ